MRTTACLLLLCCVCACGQKGPLFLPNENLPGEILLDDNAQVVTSNET
jgi:predicted small lipoprotein YifL